MIVPRFHRRDSLGEQLDADVVGGLRVHDAHGRCEVLEELELRGAALRVVQEEGVRARGRSGGADESGEPGKARGLVRVGVRRLGGQSAAERRDSGGYALREAGREGAGAAGLDMASRAPVCCCYSGSPRGSSAAVATAAAAALASSGSGSSSSITCTLLMRVGLKPGTAGSRG